MPSLRSPTVNQSSLIHTLLKWLGIIIAPLLLIANSIAFVGAVSTGWLHALIGSESVANDLNDATVVVFSLAVDIVMITLAIDLRMGLKARAHRRASSQWGFRFNAFFLGALIGLNTLTFMSFFATALRPTTFVGWLIVVIRSFFVPISAIFLIMHQWLENYRTEQIIHKMETNYIAAIDRKIDREDLEQKTMQDLLTGLVQLQTRDNQSEDFAHEQHTTNVILSAFDPSPQTHSPTTRIPPPKPAQTIPQEEQTDPVSAALKDILARYPAIPRSTARQWLVKLQESSPQLDADELAQFGGERAQHYLARQPRHATIRPIQPQPKRLRLTPPHNS